MHQPTDGLDLILAGIRVRIIPLHGERLAARLAGYEAAGIPEEEPEIVLQLTPEEVEAKKQETIQLLTRHGMEIPDTDDSFYEYMGLFDQLLHALIRHRVIHIHGSAICVNGQGYLFIAPSGTGKSTHARLWRERYGGEVVMINDDKPLIRFTDDEIFLCGNPWNGKHGLGSPIEAPLRGVVRIRRGEQNAIRRLDIGRSLKELFIQTYQFKDREKMQIVLELLGKIVTKVPCFELHCNMDPAAAETAREALENSIE